VSDKNNLSSSGITLLNYIFKFIKPDYIGTVGCNSMALKIYKVLGFKVGHMQQYYIKNDKLKKYKLIKCSKISRYPKSIYNIELSNKSSLLFYFNIKNYLKLEKKFNKNYKYYVNKFEKNPFYNYTFLLIRENKKIKGFFVARVCSFKNSIALRLVDYFGPNSLLKKISKPLKNYIVLNKFEYLDFINYGYEKISLEKFGFEKNLFKSSTIIPNYYEPFKKENIKILFAIWPSNFKFPIFKADCDQDRPNII